MGKKDTDHSLDVTPEQALRLLVLNPELFLLRHVFTLTGGTVSGVTTARISTLSVLPHGPNKGFAVKIHNPAPDAKDFQVHNLAMQTNQDCPELGRIKGYRLQGGPPFLITGVLSGCSIALLEEGGSLTLAHISPGDVHGQGEQLQDTLVSTGRFEGKPGLPFTAVYGKNDYAGSVAHLLGVRRKKVWEIYAQEVRGTFGGMHVAAVKRIGLVARGPGPAVSTSN
jgi:hypothetical protein